MFFFFFFNDTATTEIYTLSLHDALPIFIVHENFAGSSLRSNAVLNFLATLPMAQRRHWFVCLVGASFKTLDAMQADRKSTRLNSSHSQISYAVFCLKKKKHNLRVPSK